MSLEMDQCNSIQNAYKTLLKSYESEREILLSLSVLQFQCAKELVDKGNTQPFRLDQQVYLQNEIVKIMERKKLDLLNIDSSSTIAAIVLFRQFRTR